MSEPLYELTVNFKDLTDEGARFLTKWIASASETKYRAYWISKAEQEDDGETERTGHWEKEFLETGRMPGEYTARYRCSECGRLEDTMANYCPDCGAWMEGSGDE